jgi:hypothetical protein
MWREGHSSTCPPVLHTPYLYKMADVESQVVNLHTVKASLLYTGRVSIFILGAKEM